MPAGTGNPRRLGERRRQVGRLDERIGRPAAADRPRQATINGTPTACS